MFRFLITSIILALMILLTSCSPNNELMINNTNSTNLTVINGLNQTNNDSKVFFDKKIVFWKVSFDELTTSNDYLLKELIKTITPYDFVVISGVKTKSPLTFQRALINNGYSGKIFYFSESNDSDYYFVLMNDERDVKELRIFSNKDYHNNLLLAHLLLGGSKDYYFLFMDVNPTFAISENLALQGLVDGLVQEMNIDERGLVIIGSLFSDCYYADERVPHGFSSLVHQDTTVTADACSYDRIIVGSVDGVCDFGVDYYDLSRKLPLDVASALSSHYPVFLRLCSGVVGGGVV